MQSSHDRRTGLRAEPRKAYFFDYAAAAHKIALMPLKVTGGVRSIRAMNEALNGFARLGWHYEQICRLADGFEPDFSIGALRALISYDKTEKAKARALVP